MPKSNKNSHPAVSIILPTYNRRNLIRRSLDSVFCQTYEDFEVIVVDDGSSDDTAAVVAQFDDLRLKYIQNKTNLGASAARNVGLRMAQGKFLAFQDSDDEWLPKKLEVQMRVFENHPSPSQIVYSDMYRILKNGFSEYYHSPELKSKCILNPMTQFYQVYGLGIQSAIIPKECFDRVGLFNEKLPLFVDLELFIRLSKYFEFHHIHQPLVNYYETEGITKNMLKSYLARRELLRLYHKDLMCDKYFLAKEYFSVYLSILLKKVRFYLGH